MIIVIVIVKIRVIIIVGLIIINKKIYIQNRPTTLIKL